MGSGRDSDALSVWVRQGRILGLDLTAFQDRLKAVCRFVVEKVTPEGRKAGARTVFLFRPRPRDRTRGYA